MQIIQNFLPLNLINDVKSFVRQQTNHRSNYTSWNNNIIYNSSPIIIFDLNEQWNEDWGGYLAYEANEEIKCLKPNFNTAIVTIPPMRHTVFLVNPQAPIRESIQIFKNKCLI
jgi:Rps23 Pro-64 3,4-dihydroxylase Tpa1-like proline 4-hydroxylase